MFILHRFQPQPKAGPTPLNPFIWITVGLFAAASYVFPPAHANPSTSGASTSASHPAAPPPQTLNLQALGKELASGGLAGWVHGAVEDQSLYVFTYRDPKDFFTSIEFPIVPRDEKIRQQLRRLRRHDHVLVKGRFIENTSPLRHILVTELKPLQLWEKGASLPEYTYEASLPSALKGKNPIVAKVHAVAEEGRVLVIEYQDRILPVFVPDPASARALYRGDKIRLRYVIQERPGQPVHLRPDPKVKQPIRVLAPIKSRHGKKATLEGVLVQFPQSPQIRFDVYALQTLDRDGIVLDYTLVNFKNPETFQKIRQKLETVWKQHESHVVSGRNKLVNPKIRVRATGVLNIQAPNQANPQIVLDDEAAIRVIATP